MPDSNPDLHALGCPMLVPVADLGINNHTSLLNFCDGAFQGCSHPTKT